MPFAAFGLTRLLLASTIVFFLNLAQTEHLSDAFLDMMLVGRIPFTSAMMSVEAFFAGVIFAIWGITTYQFTMRAIETITDRLRHPEATLEEAAL